MRPGGNAEHVFDVRDTFTFDRDVGFVSGRAQSDGGGLTGADVSIDEAIDFQGGQDVAVADKERFVPDPGFDVLEPTSGFEKDRFVEEGEGCISIGPVGECFFPLPGQVVGVDGELLDSGGQAVVEGVFDEGPVKDRDERFGKDVGERTQTRTQTGSEEKGFLDR